MTHYKEILTAPCIVQGGDSLDNLYSINKEELKGTSRF